MALSLSSILFSLRPYDQNNVRALSDSFKNNERMRALIGRKKQDVQKHMQVVISFCYCMVKKWNGVFVSKDDNTFLLYYRKDEYRFSGYDLCRYLYLAFVVIGIKRLPAVFKRQKKVRQTRRLQAQKNKDKDYLYVWFLANKESRSGLGGLLEVKKYIFKIAKEINLPIYMETTDERLVGIYKRAGFEFYNEILDEDTGVKIWFGRSKG